ncbi:hypothetical protein NPIL_442411 [Nephila pilipes]|uniref:Uncharacterized protein n=1 Tax=Nephila pilipes TaxID=299642 RepID=A0A8X6MVW8_NEPPI|nr:hypothetical protein NPIL_442411 [Nephila pilipes]
MSKKRVRKRCSADRDKDTSKVFLPTPELERTTQMYVWLDFQVDVDEIKTLVTECELLEINKGRFNIPPERNDEFKCDLLESLKNIVGSKSESVCFTIVELLLFAVKPSINLASENESESS